jgi:type 1 glutamine amidotransferase
MAALALVVSAAPASARERQVVVISETKGFVHDSIPAAVSYLERLGARSRRYDVRHLDEGVRGLTAARLRGTDALVFANTSGELPLTAGQKRSLVRFVRRGGGIVGTHSASDTLHHWAGWERLLGAEFRRHPAPALGTVRVEDRTHPATRSLARSFRIREEFYEFRTSPRRRAHVLARLEPASIGGPAGADRPLVWCRREGRGRVFYDALGHFPATWRDSRQRSLVAGGLSWALGVERAPGCG